MRCGALVRSLGSPPNIVSFARLVMAPFIVLAVVSGARGVAVALFAAAMVSDWLDGHLARRLGLVSDAGRVLDPVADKVVVDATAVALASRGELAGWVAALLVVRDAGIVIGALALARMREGVPSSNIVGKAAFTLIGLMVLVHLLDLKQLEAGSVWVGAAAAVLSAASYAHKGIVHSRGGSR